MQRGAELLGIEDLTTHASHFTKLTTTDTIVNYGILEKSRITSPNSPVRTPPPTATPAPTPVVTWDVYKGDRKVLVVRNQPGPITSTAMLPPGGKPATHPFLSANALDPMEEHNLREILIKSQSFDEFISLLKASGYRLEKPR